MCSCLFCLQVWDCAGSLYVVDAARVMPPEAPQATLPVVIIPASDDKPVLFVDMRVDSLLKEVARAVDCPVESLFAIELAESSGKLQLSLLSLEQEPERA